MPAGRAHEQAQEPHDVDRGRDGERSAAGRAVDDPAHNRCQVPAPLPLVAAVQPAALGALPVLAVILDLEADRARVRRLVSAGRHRWGTWWRRSRR